MEFPVGLLKGLGHPFDGFHNFQAVQQLHVHPAGVADEAQNGDLLALGDVNIQMHGFEPIYQVAGLIRGGAVLQYRNHI